MRKILKKYFIPNAENEYRPHFLREAGFFALTFFILLFFFASLFQSALLTKTDFFAGIVSSVLADLANKDRTNISLQRLSVNARLQEAARLKAYDMASKGYFAHTSPEGITPWFWFTEAGYSFLYAGENLAVHFSDSEELNDAWMESPRHRANILDHRFTEVGIATARGIYEGKETVFVVQMFGKPIASAAAAPRTQIANGGDTKSAEIAKEELQEHERENMFITAKNVAGAETAEVLSEDISSSVQPPLWDYAAVSPQKTLNYLYIFIGALVFSALVLLIFVEMERQHPRHIFYGIFLLVLIGTLTYVVHTFIFPEAVIL